MFFLNSRIFMFQFLSFLCLLKYIGIDREELDYYFYFQLGNVTVRNKFC